MTQQAALIHMIHAIEAQIMDNEATTRPLKVGGWSLKSGGGVVQVYAAQYAEAFQYVDTQDYPPSRWWD